MQCLRVWRMGGIWNACVGLRFQPWNMYIGHNTTIRIWRSIETYIHEHTNALRPAVRDKFRYDNVSFPYTERCYECEQFLRTHTHTHTSIAHGEDMQAIYTLTRAQAYTRRGNGVHHLQYTYIQRTTQMCVGLRSCTLYTCIVCARMLVFLYRNTYRSSEI